LGTEWLQSREAGSRRSCITAASAKPNIVANVIEGSGAGEAAKAASLRELTAEGTESAVVAAERSHNGY